MIDHECLLQVLQVPLISEKSSILMEKYNTFVFKVRKDSTKLEIKISIQELFKVKVNHVRTLIVHGKIKKHKRYIGHRSDWKKAYITLKKGQHIPFPENIDKL